MMTPVVKGYTSLLVIIILAVAGFIFGLRSCLSRYDEREAIPQVLYFKNDTSSVLFSLVKYTKVNSYSNTGGFTRKTISEYYYVQCNNAITGEKINSRKVAADVKNFPEKILGAEGRHAWAFVNELMAFDAFSLAKVADVKMIEAKNPLLKGMMPNASQYYEFNDSAKGIVFKTNDGAKWLIHSNTLIAQPYVEPQKLNNKTQAEKLASNLQDRLKDLRKTGLAFNQLQVNQDTFNHQWLGLYSKGEIETINTMLSFTSHYGQDERRQFYNATYGLSRYERFEFDKPVLQVSTANTYYLNGGFLADKETGKAIHLSDPTGYMMIYKKVIGAEGEIFISHISQEGKTFWELNTGVKKWVDYYFAGNILFIFANDNKAIDSGNCSILLIVDCQTGSVKRYDYFKDQMRQ
ncbi:MAG: PA2928 family protein [Ferruginibacter sp.]